MPNHQNAFLRYIDEQPHQRYRATKNALAAQFDRATPHDGEVIERGGIVPLATYANGQTVLAFPKLVMEPIESFNNLLQLGYQGGTGDTQGVEDAFNVAGGAMTGGLLAPRPRNSVGALSSRIQKQIHEAQVAANPGADPNKLAQVMMDKHGDISVRSPAGWLDAVQESPQGNVLVAGAKLDKGQPRGVGYGSAMYQKLADFARSRGVDIESDAAVSALAQRMYNGPLSKYGVETASGATYTPSGAIVAPDGVGSVYTVRTGDNATRVPPPLPDNLLYANGGRPGGALGAAVNDPQEDPWLKLLRRGDI